MKNRAASAEEREDNDVLAACQWCKGLITPYTDGSVICPKSRCTDTPLNTSSSKKPSAAIDGHALTEYRAVSFGAE